jgi:methyltransferase-like protein/2-polyprenyl-3-methyl-5-hydroxy-6-metoxy-1,4-benzoquinol methylase
MNPYDHVPYDDLAFAQTHPDRLATNARLFGLEPPPIEACRVLELGCASGGNLLPMAFNLPDATFIGIDLSARQIARGRETINALNICNATLHHASLTEITEAWGEFDYIICHGVFSWVESPVQDAILRIARANLASNGVAYISYNTYPGWHMREAIRDMMRYHTAQFDDPAERIEQARALLHFLQSAADDNGAYGDLLRREAERLRLTSDSYLYHEHLEQTNTPLYFHQFIERAERTGLQYLGEADFTDMLASVVLPGEVAATLDRISSNILHLEQYMDFVRNRLFRQTLLCHSSLTPNRALAPATLRGLQLSSRARPEQLPVDLSPGRPLVLWNGQQRADVHSPPSKAAYALLDEQWPRAVPVEQLCSLAFERVAAFVPDGQRSEGRRLLMDDLFGGLTHGLLEAHTYAPVCASTVSDTPVAHAFARFQAENGMAVTNVHHHTLRLDDFAREVLRLCNGSRTCEAMVDELLGRFVEGALTIESEGQLITDPDQARGLLAARVATALATLVRQAVIVA